MRTRVLAALAITIFLTVEPAAKARTPPVNVELWRLDCGKFDNFDGSGMADDDRYVGRRMNLVDGCYVIRHGSEYVIWDTGLPVGISAPFISGSVIGPKRSIMEQLAEIGATADQVTTIGISHWHFDHTSQSCKFPQARLLIGRKDWEILKSQPPTEALKPWLQGGAKLDLLDSDEDVFGDGTVRMIFTPGHTPGHYSLIVKLKAKGTVMLTGDLWHNRENFNHSAVPLENVSRADALASVDRFKRLAKRYRATIIIQHEPADVAQLPPFPRSAK